MYGDVLDGIIAAAGIGAMIAIVGLIALHFLPEDDDRA